MIALKYQQKEGVVLWGVDFKKFFDKEVLVDCMSTIAEAQVDPLNLP